MSILGFAKRLFGSSNDRRVRRLRPMVEKVNALEPEMEALGDDEFPRRMAEWRRQVEAGEARLDDLMVPVFALVREASKRALGMRPFDVQLIGAAILHEGSIAEMRTGEGKTLVATLAVALNALSGKGVHVVTVNDYLARRDAEWMGKLYGFLGLTTGIIVHGITDEGRKQAYNCDITYATNNELGFDYLRDNMKMSREQMVQRPHNYAIVDEVDSILIDEARTPLIISGPLEDKSDLYLTIDAFIPQLDDSDFEVDEKQKTVTFTEEGNEKVEQLLKAAGLLKGDGLYDVENVTVVHHINNALKAHRIFQRDRDYIVRGDEVVIIDEFTGRMMPGRRYSDGLHQALEAKEKVRIQPENQTLASITFQNYFRLYEKLAGMTGTAATEAEEFGNIYGLGVVEVPTNRPVARLDEDDEVYRTNAEKVSAIVEDIRDAQARGQPVLVGTVSIEKSEALARELEKAGITNFEVLNARHHEREAQIVAQAGVPGRVTIATNMAGRGTDIQLGGNAEMRIAAECEGLEGAAREEREAAIRAEIEALKRQALEAGGLYVLATERHESRRIDNQLRGRSGRQGDPGRSKFFLSLQDDLLRIFGSDRLDKWLKGLGLQEGEAIVSPMVNKSLERAQKKVEARNFDIRKNLLKFDDVANDQRKVVFEQRLELMGDDAVDETVTDMRHEVIEEIVAKHIPEKAYAEQWDVEGLAQEVRDVLGLDLPIAEWAAEEGIAEDDLEERIVAASDAQTAEKADRFGPEVMAYVRRSLILQTLDHLWREHLAALDHLRSVVGMRGYAQRDPLQEYKREGFELFQAMLGNLRRLVTQQLARVELVREAAEEPDPGLPPMRARHMDATTGEDDYAEADYAVDPAERDEEDPGTWGRVGRNEPCPCGSGKKFKHCHGALA